MEAKGNIRKEVFARRRAATQEEIQEKSRMIYEKITALPEFLDADCFFAYMDFKKEDAFLPRFRTPRRGIPACPAGSQYGTQSAADTRIRPPRNDPFFRNQTDALPVKGG